MVLFKRKPVLFVTKPSIYADQEIWIIEETEEIFTNYDDYLERMDFYHQKRFICEITGHSGLDFFTALRNETEASTEVNDSFPDSLREPILRKVQFSTRSRIDNLVDYIFEEFKQDFYPGESVTCILDAGDRLNGIVREKTKFPELTNADGGVERKGFARYFVSLTNRPDEEALVDADHIVRDRKTFTKQMLRSFLKNTIQREAWAGAPWLVKSKIAAEYRIATEVPAHLLYENQLARRKASLSLRKGELDGALLSFFSAQPRLPELKPKGARGKGTPQEQARSRQEQFLQYQRTLDGNPAFKFAQVPVVANLPGQTVGPQNDQQLLRFISQNQNFPTITSKGVLKPPPTQPIKYPIEDLEVPPVRSGPRRPDLKFLSDDVPGKKPPDQICNSAKSSILMESVGPLLETWNTLNVYCEVFQLDSFTFDEYVASLQSTSQETQCELLVEIHCAVLKKLVNHEKDLNGQVQISLPPASQEDGDDESSPNSGTLPTPTPEPEITPRTTRSSLAKKELMEQRAQAAADAKLHRAAEIDQCIKGYGWRFRLRKRDFSDNRWVIIIVGLLNLFSANPLFRPGCDRVLAKLAPPNMEPTEETAISQYTTLDINLRVKILEILCLLSLETQAIRGYMDDCTQQMTQHRKEKVEQQRSRKSAIEELKALDEERQALQPETEPMAGLEELTQAEDLKVVTEPEEDEETIADSDEEEPVQQRSLRRGKDRAIERKRKQDKERERKERAEIEKAKKPTKQAKQLDKILKKIESCKDKIKEYEAEIATLDDDLREADCPRTRVLGRDRFWNRYYWLERNAMPYAGLPTSSTADAGYANGRIWIQGPDDLERLGFIELAPAENDQYRRAFQMSVPERKILEEGPTNTYTARHWAYYDDPDEIDKLIAWLDIRGAREVKLRKELLSQRDKICHSMEKRKEYLNKPKDAGSESTEPATRLSTRTKTNVGPSRHRYMAWKNTTALHEIGHLHSEPARVPKKGVARASNKRKDAFEDEGRQTRALNRSGKPLTRQGVRYKF